jgi:hypothetical protein
MVPRKKSFAPSGPLLAATMSCALACGDDAKNGHEDSGQKAPFYVIANEVYGDTDSITYVNALSSLDDVELDLKKALEYPGGRATVAANDGKLYVAGPDSAVVERFEVHDDGSFHKAGEVSFLNYGVAELTLDPWGNTFISPTKAYLFNSSDGTAIVWNPRTMEIEGEVDTGGESFVREGMEIQATPAVVRGNRLYLAISWNNWDTYEFSEEQYLAVYDTDEDRLIELIPEKRCPALSNRIDSDEDGNLYFSNWIYSVGATLTRDGAPSCALRVKAGEERFDPDWIFRYPDAADGREGAMFAYLGDGRSLFSAFYDERVTIDQDTVPSDLVAEPAWRLWVSDLDGKNAEPVSGLGEFEWNAGAISAYHIDDHDFVLVPGDDWASTTFFEIEDERATHKFTVTGWSYQFFRLR